MSCERAKVTFTLHVMTGIPTHLLSTIVDSSIAAKQCIPPVQASPLVQHLIPADPDDPHTTAAHGIFTRALLFAVRQGPSRHPLLARAFPRLIALTRLALANPNALNVPSVSKALLQHVQHDIETLPEPAELPDRLPVAGEPLVRALIAAARRGVSLRGVVSPQSLHPATRGQLILAGILPVPDNLDPIEAGIVLRGGWWDESWVALIEQFPDPIWIAEAMAVHPWLRTEQRIQRTTETSAAAAITLSAFADLRTHAGLIRAAAASVYAARDVLIACPDLRTHAGLIRAAAASVYAARDVLIACPDLRTHADLIRAAAQDSHAARDVLIACPDLRTHADLIRAAAQASRTAKDVLIACSDLRPHADLIRAAAKDPRTAKDVLIARPNLRPHAALIRAAAREPWTAMDVLIARPDLRTHTALIRAAAQTPWTAMDVLRESPELCDCSILIEAICRDDTTLAGFLRAYPTRCEDPAITDRPTYPMALARAMADLPTLRTKSLVNRVARDPDAAAYLLTHVSDLRTHTDLIRAVAQDPRTAKDVLIACPDLRIHTDLIRAAAQDPRTAKDVLIACPDLRTHTDLIRAAAQTPWGAKDVLIACPDLRIHTDLIRAAAQSSITAQEILRVLPEARDIPLLWTSLSWDMDCLVTLVRAEPSLLSHPHMISTLRGPHDETPVARASPPAMARPLARFLQEVGPHPLVWRQLSPHERTVWAAAATIPAALRQWLDTLAERVAQDSFVWHDADDRMAAQHPVTARLTSWFRSDSDRAP